jgi:5-formyltetrahydrofolate cyclo-ligase
VDIHGPALQSLLRSARKQIRARMQALRAAIPPASRARRCDEIITRLRALPEVQRARSIALFVPMEDRAEIDLRPLGAEWSAEGRDILYPRLSEMVPGPGQAPSMNGELARAALDDLVASGAGFLEPPPSASAASRGEVDVVVVPALAVSGTGHRLGYGAGFYDRILPAYCPPAVAVVVAFDFQLLGELPVFEWDFACNIVVTDERTLRVDPPPRSG